MKSRGLGDVYKRQPHHLENHTQAQPTYEVHSYQDLLDYLDKLSKVVSIATFCYHRGSKNEGVGYGTLVLACFD